MQPQVFFLYFSYRSLSRLITVCSRADAPMVRSKGCSSIVPCHELQMKFHRFISFDCKDTDFSTVSVIFIVQTGWVELRCTSATSVITIAAPFGPDYCSHQLIININITIIFHVRIFADTKMESIFAGRNDVRFGIIRIVAVQIKFEGGEIQNCLQIICILTYKPYIFITDFRPSVSRSPCFNIGTCRSAGSVRS